MDFVSVSKMSSLMPISWIVVEMFVKSLDVMESLFVRSIQFLEKLQ